MTNRDALQNEQIVEDMKKAINQQLICQRKNEAEVEIEEQSISGIMVIL